MDQLNEPKMVIGSDEWCALSFTLIFPHQARVDSCGKKHRHARDHIKRLGALTKRKWVSCWRCILTRQPQKLRFTVSTMIDHRFIKKLKLETKNNARSFENVTFFLATKYGRSREVTLTNRRHNGYVCVGREAMNCARADCPEGAVPYCIKHQSITGSTKKQVRAS